MCDYSGRLIAWLDQELPEDAAADLEQHVRACTECRSEFDSYRRASRAFDAYCDAVCDSARNSAKSSQAPLRLPRWIAVLSGAGAAAAVALLVMLPHRTLERPRPDQQAAATTSTVLPEPAPGAINRITPIKRTREKHAVAPVQSQNTVWAPAEPGFEIAIPAEAMFPPGAVPEGVNFIADVSIAAAGLLQFSFSLF
jgi:anti-sigma factor RsiW